MIVRELEVSVLSKVPGYEYMKQAGASMLDVGETADYPVVLANLGGAWRIGVQTDVLGGDLVAVFVPNSPNPRSGGVFLIAANRVRPVGVSLAAAMGALRRCGTGAGRCWANSPWSGQPNRIFDEGDLFSVERPNRWTTARCWGRLAEPAQGSRAWQSAREALRSCCSAGIGMRFKCSSS